MNHFISGNNLTLKLHQSFDHEKHFECDHFYRYMDLTGGSKLRD